MRSFINYFVLVSFVASIVLNIVFYLDIKEKEDLIFSLTNVSPNVAGVSVSFGDKNVVKFTKSKYMENNLNKLYRNYSGTYSLYLRNLNTSETLSVNDNQTFYSASLFKIPVAISVLQDVEDKKIDLKDTIPYSNKFYYSGSGSLQNAKEGDLFSVDLLLQKLLKESDNVAQSMLMSKVQNDTSYALMPNVNRIRASEVGLMLEDFYNGKYLKQNYVDYIINTLSKTSFDDRITAGLPKDVLFAHKIGNWAESGSWHDCGIIRHQENTFVICLMSKDTTHEEFMDASRKTGIIISESLF